MAKNIWKIIGKKLYKTLINEEIIVKNKNYCLISMTFEVTETVSDESNWRIYLWRYIGIGKYKKLNFIDFF